MKPFLPLLSILSWLLACSNVVDKKEVKKVYPERVYYDYQIWGEEGKGDVTIRLQYRQGSKDGKAITWNTPGNVLVDSVALTADSTRFTGAYYELTKPVKEFIGEHAIVFVDQNGRLHKDYFLFEPFTLAEELPEKVKKKPFQIELKGLSTTAALRLVLTDTSLLSSDVNEEVKVENGKIEVTEEYLSSLTNGPVALEIHKEVEKPLGTNKGNQGRLTITYALKRQFVLVK